MVKTYELIDALKENHETIKNLSYHDSIHCNTCKLLQRIDNEQNDPVLKELPTPRDYQDAFDSQNACNLSGIVHTFSRVIDKIWNLSDQEYGGTAFVNSHPISRLYAEQINFLSSGCEYHKAYEICLEESKK